MAVIMVSDVNGQSPQGYDGMLDALSDALKRAPGFIMHMSHPSETGWRVIEVWDTKDDAARFFATHVAPRLPDGIRPKLVLQALHSLVRA